MHWNDQFLQLFEHACQRYAAGQRDWDLIFTPTEEQFLHSIGYQRREMFDFIEDYQQEGEPSAGTALLIAAVRRDYFFHVQRGQRSQHRLLPSDLPTFGDALGGVVYLPRILAKARAKLRGELDPDIMFGCGGDRHFLREHGNLPPADFLRSVWLAGDDDTAVLAIVRHQPTRDQIVR